VHEEALDEDREREVGRATINQPDSLQDIRQC
jgi:hypothetical protein